MMAADENDQKPGQPEEGQPPGREPLSPAKRKRLQKLFAHASKQMTQGQHDYASDLLAECLKGDPSNYTYVQTYVGNLQKKYKNNKTGSKLAQFKERSARGAVKKAMAQEQWDEVINQGARVLTVNPWDKTTLMSMATAAGKMGDTDPKIFYLKTAWEAGPKDPELNRAIAFALTELEQWDQAIACWQRVEQAKPDDEEAQREIAWLAVQKTIKKGGYEGSEEARKFAGGGQAQPQGQTRAQAEEEVAPQEKLKRKIAADPTELSNYFELAQLHLYNEDYEAAEKILAEAHEISDGDPDVREKWQDAEIRHIRQKIARTQDEETRNQLLEEFHEKDLLIHKERCERYPNSLRFKYDLGLRYQTVKQYNEAIKEFQQARNDARCRGLCMLALGQCFQQIKQYRLAMSHYASAIEAIPDRDAKNKKESLYLAGRLALGLKDVDAAEKHLSSLAALDFNYKDVSDLLDKISKLREKTDEPPYEIDEPGPDDD
jgi:tetratricopeptide (TPR) repeat protein